jgi:hypothetical protein
MQEENGPLWVRVAQNHAPERDILVDLEEIDLVAVHRL